MALIVQKFGGTSVANPDRIKLVSNIIKSSIEQGNKVVVVVSAMAGVTSELVSLCSAVSSLNLDSHMAEYDTALCTGEIISAALMALALQQQGLAARSLSAWQLPIITDSTYSKAFVESIDSTLLKQLLNTDTIPVITGFQGVTKDKRYITLGRGGSDTTAALIAAAIKADICQIYTDVEGVFDADPRIVHKPQLLKEVSFAEMLEFTAAGAKVLHPRCVEVAMRYNVPIKVLSSFVHTTEQAGTLIIEQSKIMEQRLITGITSNKNLLLVNIKSTVHNLNQICTILSYHNIHVELMIHNNTYTYNIIIQSMDEKKLLLILDDLIHAKKIISYEINSQISLVSIIGYGIKNDTSLIAKSLTELEKISVNVLMLNVSELRLSLLVSDQDNEKTVRSLHTLFTKK